MFTSVMIFVWCSRTDEKIEAREIEEIEKMFSTDPSEPAKTCCEKLRCNSLIPLDIILKHRYSTFSEKISLSLLMIPKYVDYVAILFISASSCL